jgi:hypothetical protein
MLHKVEWDDDDDDYELWIGTPVEGSGDGLFSDIMTAFE